MYTNEATCAYSHATHDEIVDSTSVPEHSLRLVGFLLCFLGGSEIFRDATNNHIGVTVDESLSKALDMAETSK
jgi:hypothetical protein